MSDVWTMSEADFELIKNLLYFIVFELAVIIGLWVAKALNWWKW